MADAMAQRPLAIVVTRGIIPSTGLILALSPVRDEWLERDGPPVKCILATP
jgi:hypothetical protein